VSALLDATDWTAAKQPAARCRVLHVLGKLDRGGAELRTLDVIRHLDRERYRFDFVCTSGEEGELGGEVRRLGGEVYPIAASPAFGFRLAERIRKSGYHAVHSHVHYFSGWVLRVAASTGVPVRIAHFRSTHDGRGESLRRRLQRSLMRRWIDRHATAIAGVSRAALDSALGAGWESDPRCRILYNGLAPGPFAIPGEPAEVRREFGFPVSSKLCIHVGRMDAAKNHERLISIFAALHRLRPETRLLMVGRCGGAIAERVRRRIEIAGIEKAVRFAGVRSDVPRLLKAADAMILPSVREGLPGAALEAAAAGLPVVASDLPGVLEIAPHFFGITALSLDEPDSAWACAAGQAIDQGRAANPVEALSRSVFAMRRCVKAFERLYAPAVEAAEAMR
jgi:glycosyltransferase involved in cell wall biosynthesis